MCSNQSFCVQVSGSRTDISVGVSASVGSGEWRKEVYEEKRFSF